jgi:hypothetical protein
MYEHYRLLCCLSILENALVNANKDIKEYSFPDQSTPGANCDKFTGNTLTIPVGGIKDTKGNIIKDTRFLRK